MTLKTRLRKLEDKLQREGGIPRLLIVMEGLDGRWLAGGEDMDPATVESRTHVIVIGTRLNGPQ